MSVEKLITDNLDIWISAIKTKSASGRGSSNKLELYGIKKLRELILELGVRGKLVPQDPSDEPVEALIERIEATKQQLINTCC
jgi:type I restriction enzyme S subunit